ncbi:ABC transporter substrate-binding protein [Tamaricihabitans halophyticus]|uniref:ABC transporter substrate-binding protein n=1 Tax=Tamaricihabitans halophyticus TaxID=1262583 RepID=UPI001FB333C8|nr:ABC transporter substrate-binding protein [Tamaricihabitans halophyticus]
MGTVSRRGFLRISGAGLAMAYLSGCDLGGSSSAAAEALGAAFAQPINDLDPHGPSSVDESTLLACRLIYDTPTRRTDAGIEPSLAKSWRQLDELTWELSLREDVEFHDGSKLAARDLRASLLRVRDADTAQSALWTTVEDVTVDGEHTVRISTTEPLGTMPVNLSLLFVLPADQLDSPDFFRQPVGSGPFRVTSFTPALGLNLEPAKTYWGELAKVNQVNLPYIPETSSQITSLRTGELDLLWPIPPDQLAAFDGADNVEVHTVPSYVYYFTWFNCARKPFTDPRVRRAMWHAADVAGIVRNLFGKGAEVMTAPIPKTVFGYAEQPAYQHDPELAKRELASAGYPNGFRTSLMWFDTTGPLARQLAEALISEWAKVGITVEPQSLEKADWLDRLNALDWDMELQTNTVTTGDADFTLGRLYHSEAERLGYRNERLDQLLRTASRVSDQDQRERLYAQACGLVWDDAAGIFPAALNSSYGVRSGVHGFVPAPSNQPDLRPVTLSG